jgi:hypothetical protein
VIRLACGSSETETISVHPHLISRHEEQWLVKPEDPVRIEPHLVEQQHPWCRCGFAQDPHGPNIYRPRAPRHRRWSGAELGDVEPIVNRLTGVGNQVELPGLGDAAKGRRKQPTARS